HRARAFAVDEQDPAVAVEKLDAFVRLIEQRGKQRVMPIGKRSNRISHLSFPLSEMAYMDRLDMGQLRYVNRRCPGCRSDCSGSSLYCPLSTAISRQVNQPASIGRSRRAVSLSMP